MSVNERTTLDAIALVGPTASGKTAAALHIAKHLPVEIISMDSALVYRGMDIGTAKPTAQELASVPHHLIDILEPTQVYSAADFERDALALIRDIKSRGKLPLIVGGTMLYLKALIEGLDDLPKANAQIRSRIEAQAQALGWPAMHAQLAAVDPVTAQRLAPLDAQRIERALEVWELSGKPLSQWFEESQLRQSTQPRIQIPIVSFEPNDRAWLHQRIALRFQQMIDQGFLDEMQQLRQRGDLTPDLPSMRCVGYRQAWLLQDQLQQQQLSPERFLPELLELGIVATRQLAKRQITWLRSMPQRHIILCDQVDASQQALLHVNQLVAHPHPTAAPTHDKSKTALDVQSHRETPED
jgi:tRNA dimethylallyltransferase